MPASSAPSTAQMAATLEISCVTGAAWPTTAGMNEWASPYSLGMATVNTLFMTPTRISGRMAMNGLASFATGKRFRFLERTRAVAFTGGRGAAAAPVEVNQAGTKMNTAPMVPSQGAA